LNGLLRNPINEVELNDFRQTQEHDLKSLLVALVKAQPCIEEIYLFGSRAYHTGSLRSDCDLLVRVAREKNVKASDLRDYAAEHCEALDLFVCADARAVSCANDSFVYAETFESLAAKLDAILLWNRSDGFTDFAFADTGSWLFRTAASVSFILTTLPDSVLTEQAWMGKIRAVEQNGLPARPYIGDTLPKAATMIEELVRSMVFGPADLGQRGRARGGWSVDLQSEYDCQNLFYTVVKPWLPELGREEVEIYFDDQAKRSDFSLFQGRLIIEMKFIESENKKREVVKTLDGLKRFYTRNANVGCLLMVIYVKGGVAVDAAKWQAEFSHRTESPSVSTIVVPIP
jgi:predicted nucleotidyltransferase